MKKKIPRLSTRVGLLDKSSTQEEYKNSEDRIANSMGYVDSMGTVTVESSE